VAHQLIKVLMQKYGWYLVAYDIADYKRLNRVHRIMKKEGLAVQRSVFFIRGTERQIRHLMDRLEPIIKKKEDNVLAYPVIGLGEIWFSGPNPLADYPLVTDGHEMIDHRKMTGKVKKCFLRIFSKQ
jgi:CRISPR-associated endonuclease Cas2